MGTGRRIYRVVRSVLFTLLAVVAGLFVILYVLVSLPPVQRVLKEKLSALASETIGAPLYCDRLDIRPFNEVRLHGIRLLAPDGRLCARAEVIGAGIDLGSLLFGGRIELTYAEIIGLDARLWKDAPDAPLNIQFLIDALSSKDKKKSPPKLDLKLHNVVIRRSSFSWDRRWIAAISDPRRIDFNHIRLTDVKADVAIPRIADNDFEVDLRRLAFREASGLELRALTLLAHVTDRRIALSDLNIRIGDSEICPSDITIDFNGFPDLIPAFKGTPHALSIIGARIVPSDFTAFLPALFSMQSPYMLDIVAEGDAALLALSRFSLRSADDDVSLEFSGRASDLSDPVNMKVGVDGLKLYASRKGIHSLLSALLPEKQDLLAMMWKLGDVTVGLDGDVTFSERGVALSGSVSSNVASASLDLNGRWTDSRNASLRGSVSVADADLAAVLPDLGLGHVSADAEGDVLWEGGVLNGSLSADVPYIDYKGRRVTSLALSAEMRGRDIRASLEAGDPAAMLRADLVHSAGAALPVWNVDCDIAEFAPSAFGLVPALGESRLSGALHAEVSGSNPDNITGSMSLSGLRVSSSRKGDLRLDRMALDATCDSLGKRRYSLDSDICSLSAVSDRPVSADIATVKRLVSTVLPEYLSITDAARGVAAPGNFSLSMKLLPSDEVFGFLNLPVRPLTAATLEAAYSSDSDRLDLRLDAPYLQQGKNKLIKNTSLGIALSGSEGLTGLVAANMPLKNDRISLDISLDGSDNELGAAIGWVMEANPSNTGRIDMIASSLRNPLNGAKGLLVKVLDSSFTLSDEKWNVAPARVSYIDGRAEIDNILVSHDSQFLRIGGAASRSPLDMVTVNLAGIDLQYIFDILNINYVNFGGLATGRVIASDLFSDRPILRTERLDVAGFAYNDAPLGDAMLESHWDPENKMVAINADISEGDIASARVRGGIYVTRDSLSFDFDTRNLNIECLAPFMSGFTSSVRGRATGNLKLYGTFADIDLGGRMYADTISMLVDQTNVVYSASAPVIFTPGRITIPELRLYDRFGHSAQLRGEVRHRFLHDAAFDFEISKASRLLVFDTDSRDNEVWYGRIFANGDVALRGAPGIVTLAGTLTSASGSSFTFSLDGKETAADYAFLTFTDRRKEERQMLEAESQEESIEERFSRTLSNKAQAAPSRFSMNLNLNVNPDATINLVMDPDAGDKIVANGSGALRFAYDTSSDEFLLYGKYVLDKGSYNFSLQDLILRNFTIRNGSSISFNGDPMQGSLDISAAYRVNTNITDLDRSFENDPDLNRRNVPVDAILNVTGEISAPEIKFDLDLPTMTPEVERKIRSIVSTEEMLNIQVIYLLALNRFYTPDYSGSGQGGELASVASSTISSQISNIIGSLTDKFTLAPSFKSDRNDFSDLEFDLALSSSLLNNRLLINGNFGYRDKNTSLTTFVGDFDIEYLLNRAGSLRLKAYNRFNDASYYLKSALTTQGLGIIYRKDFDNPFSFLRRKRKKQ